MGGSAGFRDKRSGLCKKRKRRAEAAVRRLAGGWKIVCQTSAVCANNFQTMFSARTQSLFLRLFPAHERELHAFLAAAVRDAASREDVFQETAAAPRIHLNMVLQPAQRSSGVLIFGMPRREASKTRRIS